MRARPWGWEWSHCLRPELAQADESGAGVMSTLLDEFVRREVLELVRRHFSEDTYLEWLNSIARVPYVYEELAEIPTLFEDMYVRRAG
jgi:hypothetical protein